MGIANLRNSYASVHKKAPLRLRVVFPCYAKPYQFPTEASYFFLGFFRPFVDSFLIMIAQIILNGVSPGSSRALGREIKATTRRGVGRLDCSTGTWTKTKIRKATFSMLLIDGHSPKH